MTQKLTKLQIDEFAEQIRAGGVAAARQVYDKLYANGYNYAGWAAGVARGDSVSGQSALSFMRETALVGPSGPAVESMTSTGVDKLRVDMALGYLSILRAKSTSTGFVDNDVTYDETKKFHSTAFSKNGLTLANWTLEIPMALIAKKFGDAEVEALWVRIRDTGGDGLDGALAGLALLNKVGLIATTSPDAEDRQRAGQWLDRTPGIVNFAQMGSLFGAMTNAAVETVSQAVKSVIGVAWTSANGTPQNVKTDNKMIGADVGVWNLYRSGSVDQQFFRDFTRWSSNEWLNGSSTTGFQSTATFGLQPSGEFGYKPPSSGFWAPIGAFYDSQSEKFNAAAGIAAYLPVVLDANLKAVTAEQLGALDADHDGKLSVVESAGLKFWRDVNEQGLADDGEIGAVDRVISAADFGLYTQGNGNASSNSASSAARQELAALRLETPWRLAAPSRVEAQPWKEERGFGFSFSLDNASSLRRWDTRYTVNANTWIDWRADQIMITSDKTKLVGTDGNDRFDASYYASYTQYFNVDLLTRFYAGAGNDLMGGSVRADELFGGTGNDSLLGQAGDDQLEGGLGNDSLDGGQGHDVLLGEAGNDLALGGDGNDELQGNEGDDQLLGEAGNDRLFGQAGNDTLLGGDGNDVMVGFAASNDAKQTLAAGETDDDIMLGERGNDDMYGGLGNDSMDGGVGDDVMLGEAGNDQLQGGDGSDELQGNEGDDQLAGGTGDDRLFGQVGNDTLMGGDGNDPTLPAAQLGGSNVADQQHLLDSYGVRNDVVAGYNEGGIANLVRSGRGVIIAVNAGKLWDDAAYVGNGSVNHAVTLTGAVYDATTGDLAGFYLTDSGRGKVGDMTRYLSVEAFRAAANVANAYAIYTIEPVKYWEENIAGTGNALDNTLVGNRGDNLLAGMAGNDTLEGGAGSDTYQFGRGDGTDRIVENDATAGHRDVAQFSPDVASDQLWFRKTGNDLEVSIVGSDDRFVIDNWYGGAEHHVEQFKAGDGKWLSDSGVQSLVDAMARFSPPAAGEINLPPNYHASLQTQIAANWH